ncbi:hypothetical protein ONZ45_g8208 [Pleurotus djamor]|nr:hypothetical protein ONZ45_g8208 [Pleurotus djamor]
MSLPRVVLVLIQAFANHIAFIPPNPTPQKARYHTDELYILQIAPLIFKIHQIIIWICTFFEVLYYVGTFVPAPLPPTQSTSPLSSLSALPSLICPSSSSPSSPSSPLTLTPLFLIGVSACVLGTYIRLDCFKTLGHLFTFDLTLLPEHRLITSRFYRYVRHPAYTGSMLLVMGLAFSHLSEGSWLTECGPLSVRYPFSGLMGSAAEGGGKRVAAVVIWASWWIWTLAVGISRADAEDKQMKKVFGREWEEYAANVPWWFFPGLI